MRFRSSAGNGRWTSHLVATVLFAALCGIASYWALQLLAPRTAIAPAGSLVDWQKAPDLAAASRLFGVPSAAGQARQVAAVASNISVIGIAASTHRGSAILSIYGGPAKAILAGEAIAEQATLLEVHADRVVIEQSGNRIELPTPDRPDPALLSAGPAASPATAAPVPVAARPAGTRPPPAATAPPAQEGSMSDSPSTALPQLAPGIRR